MIDSDLQFSGLGVLNMTLSYLNRSFVPLAFVVLVFGCATTSLGQLGNSITGHVFGVNRQPVADVYVELLDDLSRTIGRERTNGSGQYSFFRLPSGRFILRVLTMGTGYEEQEQTVEITNFIAPPGTPGGSRILGAQSEQRDFYLRLRRDADPALVGTLFAQDVPAEAKKLYDAAVVDIGNKKNAEAYERLKSAIEIFPKYFAALELLGLEYVQAGHMEAARILLTMASDINPRAYRSWYGLAVAQNALKHSEEALEASEKSIELNSSFPEGHLLSGSLLRQAKRYDDAEKRLLKAKQLARGGLPDIHWELALLYANGLKNYADASRELKLYLKANPNHKDAEKIQKLISEFESKAKGS